MKTKTTRLIALAIILLTFLGSSIFAALLYSTSRAHAAPDWLSGFSYRRKLTVNEASIDADLANFPALVKLDSSFFDFNNNDIIDVYDPFHFAKRYAKSRQGTGVLYAHIPDPEEEVEKNGAGNYLVYPGATYHFNITGITEYENTNISVWAFYKIGDTTYNTKIGDFEIGASPSDIEFDWTVPSDLPITTSIKFKYGTNYQGPIGIWVYARKDLSPSPRLLLVVPETLLGSLGAIAALFVGFKIKSFARKRKQHSS